MSLESPRPIRWGEGQGEGKSGCIAPALREIARSRERESFPRTHPRPLRGRGVGLLDSPPWRGQGWVPAVAVQQQPNTR